MATIGETTIEQNDNYVKLSRVFEAPKELVYSMFKDAERMKQWWGPEQCPLTDCIIDFREGGTCLYAMTVPDGTKAWGKMIYEEIDEPDKLVFRDVFSDEAGNENPDLPSGHSVVTFEETDGKTTLTMRGEYATPAEREKIVAMGMLEGMRETWQALDDRLRDLQTAA